jgi:hypothetical protein
MKLTVATRQTNCRLSFSSAFPSLGRPRSYPASAAAGTLGKIADAVRQSPVPGDQREQVLDEPSVVIAGLLFRPLERVGTQVEQLWCAQRDQYTEINGIVSAEGTGLTTATSLGCVTTNTRRCSWNSRRMAWRSGCSHAAAPSLANALPPARDSRPPSWCASRCGTGLYRHRAR